MTVDLTGASVPELLTLYAGILDELKSRNVIRTRNAPLGDYAEYLAVLKYVGVIAPNSEKSFDLLTADGVRVQVKARTVNANTRASESFSPFRSWDFDVAVFLVFDAASYALKWAREMTAAEVQGLSRLSAHVNGSTVRLPLVKRSGTDVTDSFAEVLASLR